MSNNDHSPVVRAVCTTLLVHTLFIIATVPTAYFLWWERGSLWGRHIEKYLVRVVEFPVLWIVEYALQNVPPIVPPGAGSLSSGFAFVLDEVVLFSVTGGVFYSLVAAAVAWARLRSWPGRED